MQKNWKLGLKYLHTLSCLINSSLEVQATQISIDDEYTNKM